MNWLDQLQQFRDNNPDLPPGDDTASQSTDEDTPRQRARLDIILERKGRAGHPATLVSGWDVPDEQVLEIAAALKKRLGTGGSARGGDILIQGDRRKEVLSHLTDMGYKARII